MRPGVFLDRDGVLVANTWRDGRAVAVRTVAQMELLPGAQDALARLKEAGFGLAVVTNQPDVSTGHIDAREMEGMNSWLRERLPIDAIKICTHVDRDGCACRKPKAGLLLEAAVELGLDVARSYMIGDRWRDISAGAAINCRTILVGDGYGEKFPDPPDHIASDIAAASKIVLSYLPHEE